MVDATHADSAHIKPVAPAAEDSPVPLAAAVSSADAFRRFWPWARPDRYWLAASVVLLIAGSAGEVASVWLFKNLVDQVLIPHRFTAFLPLAGLMAAVAVVAAPRHPLRPFAGSERSSTTRSATRSTPGFCPRTLPPQVQWKAPEQVEEELDPATVPDPRQALALLDERRESL
ncbi:hypothetical protein ACFU8W_19360 [Streptomyces sp. NPDC057565]|uniref:hypothetical protein n=1 Tax=Streptomyces sp. NPDC057565 TaxID=3346169 RepID=UPI0036A83C89